MNSKLVYAGGYVRTSLLSEHFKPVSVDGYLDSACIKCRRATCGPYYFHLESKTVMCTKCYGKQYPGWERFGA